MFRIAVCLEQEHVKGNYVNYIKRIQEEQNIGMEVTCYKDEKQLLFEWTEAVDLADILFLEVNAEKGIDGLAVAAELRERKIHVPIVLVMEDEKYAFDAFDVQALYCVATEKMDDNRQFDIVQKSIKKAIDRTYQHIVFSNREEECRVLLKDIYYFEVIDHRITMHYQRWNETQQTFTFIGSMGKIGQSLRNKGFIFPHRSYVVARDYIKQVTKGTIILMNDLEIGISRARRQEVKKQIEETL